MDNAFDILRTIETFEKVPDSQLQFLIDNGEEKSYAIGETLFSPGEAANHLIIILEGKFGVFLERNGNFVELGEFDAHYITGILPYSRMEKAQAKGVAKHPSRTLEIHKKHFTEMIQGKHDLVTALVHFMTSRVRDFSERRSTEEKLTALGKLSAGLAHELNNPASAIVRSSQALKKHLGLVPEKFKQIMSLKVTDELTDSINGIMNEKMKAGVQSLSLMEKTEREDELAEWLEENGAEDGYEMAENFVDFGFSIEEMELIKNKLDGKHVITILHWINSNLATERMVEEIQESSKRIADLVKSIKAYTHMDQAPSREKVDLRVGIRNTLTMLNHKLKRQNIKIEESFTDDFPKAEIFVSEMNQVWTNLLDNAIDALETTPNPTLLIKGYQDGEYVKVHVVDNGPGIPEDIQNKIFDPFFTTKAQGKGTGLGLDVVQRLVTKNKGFIRLNSKPGITDFSVSLPIHA